MQQPRFGISFFPSLDLADDLCSSRLCCCITPTREEFVRMPFRVVMHGRVKGEEQPTVLRGYAYRLRRPGFGHPEHPIAPEDEDMTPPWGIEEGGEVVPPIEEVPDPPPGIWPPLTPEQPWRPIPGGRPERPSQGLPPTRPPAEPGQPLPPTAGQLPEIPELPPGAIWPPLPEGVHGKYLALVLVGGGGRGLHWRYVVVDADALPEPPAGGVAGRPPERPSPQHR